MTWRIVGMVLGAIVYGLVLAMAVAGSRGALALVVTSTVLILLIGGGNLFQGWLGIARKPPRFERPDLGPDEDADPDRPR